MSERQTTLFTTPGGHSVVLNAYLTGREAQQLKEVMFSALRMNVDDVQSGKVGIGDVPSSFLVEQERKGLAYLIVSLDGSTENPVERLLDLPSGEYEAVVKEVNRIQNPTTPQNSAQPGSGTSEAA